MLRLQAIISEISDFLWPRTCHICGRPLLPDNRHLCEVCLEDSLTNNIYRAAYSPVDHPANDLEPCAAWLPFNSTSRRLLHDIKYYGCSGLARFLGSRMAMIFLPTGLFNDIDCIVPVPIHATRRLRRGYNQSEMLARGVASVISRPVENALKARLHKSQTHVRKERRYANVRNAYYPVKGHRLYDSLSSPYRHVLLIDDLCTSGATLRAAVRALRLNRPDLRITILTMASVH